MKTAMQELIERLSPEQTGIKLLAESLLEKEKQQIINGHWAGWEDAYDYLREDNNERARQAEEYYEETYNKNK
jgi:hypoxanthine phosphoribosyltransferase